MADAEQKPLNRQSLRMKGFDYSSAYIYSVTICTHLSQHAFGEIRDGKMILNEAGLITHMQWLKLEERFVGIRLDQHIIMPNHMHGIVIIYPKTNIKDVPLPFQQHMQTLAEERHPILKKPYKIPNLGDIVRTYKAASTRLIRVSGAIDFAWHTNYRESRVIGNEMLHTTRNYILTNPENWQKDEEYTSTP